MSNPLATSNRIVLKLGTQVVIQEDGELARERLAAIAQQCAAWQSAGKEILLVSSGAVGLGRKVLNKQGPLSLPEKQACAAVGQSLLMEVYRELFAPHQQTIAQVLVTASDFSHRQHYLSLRDTLETLLSLQVIPILNENDTVSTMELQEEGQAKSFGDNDKLSAIIASKLEADLLIILTNVEGIYTDNPVTNPEAKRIPLVESFEQLSTIGVEGQSAYGRGGMSSKIEAARIAAISGVKTLILSGLQPEALSHLFNGKAAGFEALPGTLILPQSSLPGRKRWIALASGYQGVVVINEGAKGALVERFASLLPIGITAVQGDFQARQVVSIQDEQGNELGRGIINFSAEEARKIQGCQSKEIAQHLGPVEYDEVIHRDHLVIFQEHLT